MRTQKYFKTDSSAFTVLAESSLSVLCAAVESWGQGPAGVPVLPRDKRRCVGLSWSLRHHT